MDYGNSAIFGCPAHDQRDFDFAKKYNLEIKQVVSKEGEISNLAEAYTGDGKIINSEFLNGLTINEAKEKIISEVVKKKNWKKKYFIQIKRLGCFKATILGLPYSYDLFREWTSCACR